MTEIVVTMRDRIEGARWAIGEWLVALACRLDPETRTEQARLHEAYSTCEDIARGKIPDDEIKRAAFAATY